MPTHKPADEAAIREQAYHFWEQDGRPHGRETEYWMRATVAVSDKSQMDRLTKGPPKTSAKVEAAPKLKPTAKAAKAEPKLKAAKATPKLKAAAKTAKAAPSKSDGKAKPKKK